MRTPIYSAPTVMLSVALQMIIAWIVTTGLVKQEKVTAYHEKLAIQREEEEERKVYSKKELLVYI